MSIYRFFSYAFFSVLLLVSGCGQALKSDRSGTVAMMAAAEPNGIVRHIMFASDPQYPWPKDTKNQESSLSDSVRGQGVSRPPLPQSSVKEVSAEDLIRNQYNAIQTWRAGAMGGSSNNPVIINGDMTAFGHEEERAFLYGALDSILSTNWYFGLGNHDYKNNVGDCANDGCARDSMEDLIGRMGGNQMDYSVEESGFIHSTKKYSGSFAYFKDFGSVRYVQLNLDPSYIRWFYSSGVWTTNEFHVLSPVENGWLESVLMNARDNGKFVIIGMHDAEEWTRSSDSRTQAILTKFRKMLKEYEVSAIFAGHFHTSAGIYPGPYQGVPVFLSGSATDETFLIADINESERNFQVWLVKNNNPGAAENLGVFPLKRGVVVPPADEYDNAGGWGTWGPSAFCPDGQFINAFDVKAEEWQGDDDDTAVNAIVMYCHDNVGIRSKEGAWGDFSGYKRCPANEAVVGFQLKIEPSQGDGDDTGVDSVKLVCEGGQYIATPYDTSYGIWKKTYRCPAGTVAIGFETRVEDYQGDDDDKYDDDTALNGMRMRCGSKP
ncbi:metallophosphoesterase [Pseudomonas congelans]|uniref:metallophosphoesterase n=1 Tax=Pseudomonas congelans TaxID=200452 RepID=UPI0004E38D5C|nr:metallophosphoesterase [Pseudomonas congelans]KFE48794.1 VOMI family protein [Pseudomonas congelans]